ncbi:MAG: hypothetical protein JWM10_1489 [Myxococcaceae bacterium]|nr:hypothetical protein [Myxococcaceae bacterium]
MYPGDAPAVVLFGIPLIATAVVALVALGWRHAGGRLAPALALGAAWLALFAALASSGWLARTDARPPPFALVVLLIFAGSLGLACSSAGARLARGLPLAALVGLHAFRLPLELVMHRAATAGVMPPQMSYSGRNFDVVTGVTALLLAPFAARAPRAVLLAWNTLGLALVLNVAAVGVASSPAFRAFGPDRVNTWVLYFPFVWLPGALVTVAIAGHLVLYRRLLAPRSATRSYTQTSSRLTVASDRPSGGVPGER